MAKLSYFAKYGTNPDVVVAALSRLGTITFKENARSDDRTWTILSVSHKNVVRSVAGTGIAVSSYNEGNNNPDGGQPDIPPNGDQTNGGHPSGDQPVTPPNGG